MHLNLMKNNNLKKKSRKKTSRKTIKLNPLEKEIIKDSKDFSKDGSKDLIIF